MNIDGRITRLERGRATASPWAALPRSELWDVFHVLTAINSRRGDEPLPEDLPCLSPGAMAALREAADRLQSNNPQ